MKSLTLFFILFSSVGFAQHSVIGKWKTIDDETGKERSIVEIYEQDGLIFGKVVKTFPQPGEDPDPICNQCDPTDPRHNKKIIGMTIIQNMKKSGEEYTSGEILDPKNGRVYSCKLWVNGSELKVRGYWGVFYRTQTWKKVH